MKVKSKNKIKVLFSSVQMEDFILKLNLMDGFEISSRIPIKFVFAMFAEQSGLSFIHSLPSPSLPYVHENYYHVYESP